ncbi:hypothetical protein [uncultured Chitinophaga sp.]|uniref:hypothetical protein n=1 Tax=uncultured Chitinophaga sp. TaxID=339340 RepID=UPI0025E2545C|nr:hypothetical protein [uncultured Chitinophaga sp.]
MNTVLTYLSVLLLATTACEKEKTAQSPTPANPMHSHVAGMGARADKPDGTAFHLPKGVELRGIYGGNCQMPDANSYGMSYARVALCITLHNQTTAPVEVNLPEGLVFVSSNLAVKNGLLPKAIRFTVPGKQEIHVRIGALCMNADREMPEASDHYTLGPVYHQQRFRMFYALFNRKRIYENEGPSRRDFDAAIIAQSLFWKLGDSAALSKDDIALANSLADL